MAALRKSSIALALVLMISLLGVEAANAQPAPQPLEIIDCAAFSVPTNVRAEGLAELFGDYRLECRNTGVFDPTAAPPTAQNFVQYVPVNVEIELLNTNVTTSIGLAGVAGMSSAVLIINENNAYNPQTASSFSATCQADTRFPCPQLGELFGDNRVLWDNVSLPVPGAPNDITTLPADIDADPDPDCADFSDPLSTDSCFPTITTLRITNVRGNATVFGLGNNLPDLDARLTLTGPTAIAIDDNVKTLATPRIGLVGTITGGGSGLQCLGGELHATVTFEEGFAASFKTLGAPSFQAGGRINENGYPLLSSNSPGASVLVAGGTGGGATQGTRLMVRFFNIPAGVDVFVENQATSGAGSCTFPDGDGLCINLLDNPSDDGSGGTPNSDPGGITEVDLSGGFGFAVYEVVDANPFSRESVGVDVWFEFPFDPDNDEPVPGSGQADVTFAPLCIEDDDCAEATNLQPRPRFIDSAGEPQTIITIIRCTTTLLFPFVSNQGGFDTGIAISNTSMDWIGTQPQRGVCRIHYIGRTGPDGPAPPEDESIVLEGGEQMTFTLSGGNPDYNVVGAPDFQGFIVAQCEFQYAHGYAFLSDNFTVGLPNGFQGYLALVIPLGPDGREPGNWHAYGAGSSGTLTIVNDGFGERLGH